MNTRIILTAILAGRTAAGCSSNDAAAGSGVETSSGATTIAEATTSTGSSAGTDPASSDATSGAASLSGSSTGVDATSTGDTTTEPCAKKQTCAPAISPEWTGPVALRESTEPGSVGCGAAFDTLAATVHADLDAAPASCTCTCEATGEATCASSSEIRQHENADCEFPAEFWNITSSCNAAVAAAAGTSVYARNIEVEGVSCDAEYTEEVARAKFARELSLCAPDEPGDGCESDGVCVPDLGEAGGELCVWREGDFPCPDPWAAARYLYYRDFIDERRCSDCTCDEFYGVCTGFTILLFGTNTCNETPVGGVSPGSCEQLGNQGATAARRSGVGTPEVDCSGNAHGGDAIGSAGPTDPVTVCCLAS